MLHRGGRSLLVSTLAAGAVLAALATPGRGGTRTDPCVRPSERGSAVSFTARDGTHLAGVLLGRGRVGVVMGHELGASLCNWLPFARALAAHGYRALAFDFRDHGVSDVVPPSRSGSLDEDVLAAAGELRRRGARRIVLMGASMGGTAAIASAPAVGSRLAALVDLSGPARFAGLDALGAVAGLRAPALFAVGRDDVRFVADTRALRAGARSRVARLVVLPTAAHGTALLADARFAASVLAFVHATAPSR